MQINRKKEQKQAKFIFLDNASKHMWTLNSLLQQKAVPHSLFETEISLSHTPQDALTPRNN